MRKRGKRYLKKALRTTTYPFWKPGTQKSNVSEETCLRMFNLCTDGDGSEVITLLFPSLKEFRRMMKFYKSCAEKKSHEHS